MPSRAHAYCFLVLILILAPSKNSNTDSKCRVHFGAGFSTLLLVPSAGFATLLWFQTNHVPVLILVVSSADFSLDPTGLCKGVSKEEFGESNLELLVKVAAGEK